MGWRTSRAGLGPFEWTECGLLYGDRYRSESLPTVRRCERAWRDVVIGAMTGVSENINVLLLFYVSGACRGFKAGGVGAATEGSASV